MAGTLEHGTGTCPRCGRRAGYEVIDMTGDGARIDRQWLCPDEHRETRVQDDYPQYTR